MWPALTPLIHVLLPINLSNLKSLQPERIHGLRKIRDNAAPFILHKRLGVFKGSRQSVVKTLSAGVCTVRGEPSPCRGEQAGVIEQY